MRGYSYIPKALPLLPVLGVLLSIFGCVTIYKPNTVYSPMLKEKGEINTSAALGLSGNGLYNIQAAYAVSEHAAVMLDGMYHHRESGEENSGYEKLNIFSGEAGVGYFRKLGLENKKLFQIYSGAGYGRTADKIENSDNVNPEITARYLNAFVQPGFSLSYERVELGFDLRANYVHIYSIHAYLYDHFDWWNTDFKYYSDTTINFLNIEPAVTVRVGGPNLKGTFQLGTIIPTINSKSYFDVNTEAKFGVFLVKVAFGISYTFNTKRRT